MTKLISAKLCAVLACAESDSQLCQSLLDLQKFNVLTSRSFSLRRV